MSLSRRSFIETIGMTSAGLVMSRVVGPNGLSETVLHAAGAGPILLHNNENPVGPGEAAIAAMRASIGDTAVAMGRYPANRPAVIKAIASHYNVAPENIMLGCGSTELLRTATQVFTSKTKHLVGGSPTYEECTGYAALIGTPVKAVPLDSKLRLDLNAMAAVSKGAGFIFVNNPNNPTATIQPATAIEGFVSEVLKVSPATTIMLDEAYTDYVTDPAHKTQIPLAVKNPRVIVARTFSKAYGMAGLRIGFVIAHPDTLKVMRSWEATSSMGGLGLNAAMATIQDRARIEAEVQRNTGARQFTVDWFKKAGYESTDSQANFIFVNIKRPAKGFRDACRAQGILVGRDFAPYQNTHVRVSIGTMEEMKTATQVFGKALSAPVSTAA